MKILYGITKSNFGGAQRYVYELSVEAKRQGHDVSVLCGGEGVLVQKLNSAGIRVITISGFGRDIDLLNDLSGFFFIIQTLRAEKPDVFHINSAKMGGVGVVAGRLVGTKKIIFTAHGWAFNEPRPLWQKALIKFFTWLTLLGAHKTICVSESAKRDIENWPLIRTKLTVIKSGLKPFELLPPVPSDILTIGVTSELHPVKGLDILLRAWNKFTKKHSARLVIMGEGEERSSLEKQASELGIVDSVIFKGYIDNARAHLLDFDIFCMPSRSEGLPYSLLEAGFAGLPVIASAVGGIPEIIESGISGVLVLSEDVEGLFSTLVLLAEDEELRKRLGANLKASIQENFSFEKMVEKTFALY